MESRNIPNYIRENFETLPKDVFLRLMQDLSAVDVVSLCSTNPRIRAECIRIKAYDEALAREAPLAKQTYNVTEQISLIDRGFKTLYNVSLDNINNVYDVKFGFPYNVDAFNTRKSIFSIKGLPAPKGTKVWIMGHTGENEQMHTWREGYISAFASADHAIQFVRDNKEKGQLGPVSAIHDIALNQSENVDDVNTILQRMINPNYVAPIRPQGEVWTMDMVLDLLQREGLDGLNVLKGSFPENKVSDFLIFQEVTLP